MISLSASGQQHSCHFEALNLEGVPWPPQLAITSPRPLASQRLHDKLARRLRGQGANASKTERVPARALTTGAAVCLLCPDRDQSSHCAGAAAQPAASLAATHSMLERHDDLAPQTRAATWDVADAEHNWVCICNPFRPCCAVRVKPLATRLPARLPVCLASGCNALLQTGWHRPDNAKGRQKLRKEGSHAPPAAPNASMPPLSSMTLLSRVAQCSGAQNQHSTAHSVLQPLLAQRQLSERENSPCSSYEEPTLHDGIR
jgi:hypothetical protein